MKKILIGIVFFLFLFQGITFSQTQELIKVVRRPTTFINDDMKKKVQKIDQFAFAKKVTYVEFGNIAKIQQKGKLSFAIPYEPKRISAIMRRVEFKDENNYNAFAILGEDQGQGEMTLIREKGVVYGNINYDGESYRIYGVNASLSAIIKMDKDKMGKGDCEEPTGSRPSNFNGVPENPIAARINPCADNITRVLILFTPAAQTEDPNIQQTINLAVANFNSAVATSSINEQKAFLQIAGTQLFSFTEMPSNIKDDVEALSINSNAIAARNAALADIVVLFTAQGYSNLPPSGSNALGRVRQIDAEADSAYAIVETSSAVARNTFAHEVGHLFGGGHESPTVDPRILSYSHGRRFERRYGLFFKKRYATLMHTRPDGSNFDRVLAFANPNATFDGVTTGDASCCNVARRIRETAPRIAGYRTNPSILSGGILGTNNIYDYGVYSYEPDVTCGSAPYTYSWEMTLDGFNFTSLSSNSDGIADLDVYPSSPIAQAYEVTFRLVITSADNQQVTVFRTIEINLNNNPVLKGDKNNTSPFFAEKHSDVTISEVYPNPVQNIMSFDFYLPKEGETQITLTNLLGETVLTLEKSKLSNGYYNRKIDTQNLANGVYILNLKSGEVNISKKVTISH